MFLHESNSTVVWLRHMRWWRRWQLAIPIVWASGYERAKARHLMLGQNWKYCVLNSQPRPVTRTVNNRRSGAISRRLPSLVVVRAPRRLTSGLRRSGMPGPALFGSPNTVVSWAFCARWPQGPLGAPAKCTADGQNDKRKGYEDPELKDAVAAQLPARVNVGQLGV